MRLRRSLPIHDWKKICIFVVVVVAVGILHAVSLTTLDIQMICMELLNTQLSYVTKNKILENSMLV